MGSAAAKPFHGFIHAAADQRHFQYDDGAFYYPIGPCLRSPSDSRLPYLSDKWSKESIERLGHRGTYQYDDYLAKFPANAGINWALHLDVFVGGARLNGAATGPATRA